MKYSKLNRRMFLQSSGQFALAVPFLTSLLPRELRAQVASAPKRFIALWSPNGTVYNKWYPSVELGNADIVAPNIRMKNISQLNGNISEILGAEYSTQIKQKLTLLRGLDWLGIGDHNSGNMLTCTDSLPQEFTAQNISFDQVLLATNKIYQGSLKLSLNSAATSRVPGNAGSVGANSITYSKVGSSYVQNSVRWKPSEIFHDLFGSIAPPSQPGSDSKRQLLLSVVDKVLGDYNSVMNSNKISREDKLHLDSHVSSLRDLERKVAGTGAPTITCSVPQAPSDPVARDTQYSSANFESILSIYMDLISLAVKCDARRVITHIMADRAVRYQHIGIPADHHGNSHDEINGDSYCLQIDRIFSRKFAELITKLDVVEDSSGNTYLDNSIVIWGHEFTGVAAINHQKLDLPVLMAGGKFALQTGKYIDYRNHGVKSFSYDYSWRGLPYNQLIVTLGRAFGLTDSEMETLGEPGFGHYAPANLKFKRHTFYDTSTAARRASLPKLLLGS